MELSNKLGPALAIGMGIIATVWLLSGEQGLVQAQAESSSEATQKQPAATETVKKLFKVRAAQLEAQWISQTVRLSGYTVANQTLQINNRLAGHVTEVLVNKGANVTAGQALIRIDDRTLQANRDQARALVKQRVLELDGVQRLTNQNLTSQVSVASAQAALASAQASLAGLEVDLENSQIRAPFAGIINEFSIKPGQWLDVGEFVTTLVDVTPMKVAVQLPQNYLHQVRLGSSVDVSIQGLAPQTGTVSFISRMADSQTRSIPLEITLSEQSKALPTDISAELVLHLEQIKAHPVSPALLSINNEGQMSIKTVNQNVVEQHPVTIVRSDQDKAWISGLADQVTVITAGQGFVKVGEQVNVDIDTGVQP
ncbi:Multidrug export protein AcrE precursor [Marinomonas aquimarina]|uniref:Multidrug export protein AcrE n=1 Tax=Marinomonas aquimarina TaxID=295068 RepID=A0A1A8TPN8_9GAMM|nr:efflux RND transporter periplasmic adaptor subunit [Marinomonas aquimarina]SBS35317.1 Multidrug export protein AcrE precursor [Marinomonas aquimarina]